MVGLQICAKILGRHYKNISKYLFYANNYLGIKVKAKMYKKLCEEKERSTNVAIKMRFSIRHKKIKYTVGKMVNITFLFL